MLSTKWKNICSCLISCNTLSCVPSHIVLVLLVCYFESLHLAGVFLCENMSKAYSILSFIVWIACSQRIGRLGQSFFFEENAEFMMGSCLFVKAEISLTTDPTITSKEMSDFNNSLFLLLVLRDENINASLAIITSQSYFH